MDFKDFKKFFIPFALMFILNLSNAFIFNFVDYTAGYNPHVGVMFISGLLFGPYGALGSTLANLIYYFYDGMNLTFLVLSGIVNFAVSYLTFKLWYVKFKGRKIVTGPGFFKVRLILLFFAVILITGMVYGIIHVRLFNLFEPEYMNLTTLSGLAIYVKYVNSAGFYGLIGMVLAKRLDFIHIPRISKRKFSENFYLIIFLFLFFLLLIIGVNDLLVPVNQKDVGFELMLAVILLLIYLTRPLNHKVTYMNATITGKIMTVYAVIIVLFGLFALYWYDDDFIIPFVVNYIPFDTNDMAVIGFWAVDEIIAPFIISTLIILAYIDRKLVNPIVQFSKIEDFIGDDKKIASEDLLEMYSGFTDVDYEVGTLARSYSELIESNQYYIENIDRIERDKERIQAELDIAKRIQEANLPTEALESDDYVVNGYSRPAKEVGGDFFDYYMIDEDNLALIVGDASGKGVPAALLATITQTLIKQMLQHDTSLPRVLSQLNSQLYEHNTVTMFISLWIGIFNTKTNTLTFSNAGHNPPLIKRENGYDLLNEDVGIIMGIVPDFEFTEKQISLTDNMVLYTDGLTEAVNDDEEEYGKENLISFLNDNDDLSGLFEDIDKFAQSQDQFDDMTVVMLKLKK